MLKQIFTINIFISIFGCNNYTNKNGMLNAIHEINDLLNKIEEKEDEKNKYSKDKPVISNNDLKNEEDKPVISNNDLKNEEDKKIFDHLFTYKQNEKNKENKNLKVHTYGFWEEIVENSYENDSITWDQKSLSSLLTQVKKQEILPKGRRTRNKIEYDYNVIKKEIHLDSKTPFFVTYVTTKKINDLELKQYLAINNIPPISISWFNNDNVSYDEYDHTVKPQIFATVCGRFFNEKLNTSLLTCLSKFLAAATSRRPKPFLLEIDEKRSLARHNKRLQDSQIDSKSKNEVLSNVSLIDLYLTQIAVNSSYNTFPRRVYITSL